MSVLKQLYGEAKGIEKSLDMMNKNLQKMQVQNRRSNQLEEKYRQEILKHHRRARADEQRNRDQIADTLDNAVGKKAGRNLAKGGLLAALATGLGVAVAASLAKNRVDDVGGEEPSDTGSGGGGSTTTPDTGSETDSTPPSSSSPSQPGTKPETKTETKPEQKPNAEKIDKGAAASDAIDNTRMALNISDAVSRALSVGKFAPGIGQAIASIDIAADLASGDTWGAGFSAFGMLPGPIGWIGDGAALLKDLTTPAHVRDKQNLQLLKTLKGMGFNEIPTLGKIDDVIGQLEAYIKAQDAEKKQLGGIISGFQNGGFSGLVPDFGQPSTGDHFYTNVAPGSYIMNRNLVSAMGFQQGGVPVALEKGEIALPPGSYDRGVMDYLNHSAFPRFQAGGLVKAEHAHTGAGWSVGKDSKGRPSVFSKSAAEALMKAIKASDGAVKTSDITSSKRSAEHNKRVGGVDGSNHLSGNAVDIHGTSKAWLKEHGAKYGWHNLVYSGHDGHFDFKGGGSSGAPTRPESKVKETGEKTASTDGKDGGGAAQISDGFGKYSKAVNSFLQGIGGVLSQAGLGGILGGMGGIAGSAGDAAKGALEGAKGALGGLTQLGSGGGSLSELTDQQWSDLAYIVSSEAARGTDDEFGVAANVLTRVADPKYPNTIMGVGTQAGQYEAVYKGMARRDPKLAERLKANSDKIASALQKLNGRTEFKGQTMLNNKGASDPMFSGNGNFYHYASQKGRHDGVPENPPQHWKKWIGSQKGGARYMTGGSVLAQNLQQLNDKFKTQMMNQEPIIVYEDDEPPIAATHSGGADNNDPFYLPTRSTCWAAAIMEYRERTFNQGY